MPRRPRLTLPGIPQIKGVSTLFPDRTVDYQYDALGRVSRVSTTSAEGTTTVLAQGFNYYPFGPASSYRFGNGHSFFMELKGPGSINSPLK